MPAVNGALITLSPSLIPPPPGVDVTDAESLAASMHLFEPRHFVMPFLAHALGTLAGAFIASKIALSRKLLCALIIGLFFLGGGLWSAFLLKGPSWFLTLDLALAYIPMAWLGWKLAVGKKF